MTALWRVVEPQPCSRWQREGQDCQSAEGWMGAAGADYGRAPGAAHQPTSCRSRHTMHVVSREPEMR